MSAPTPPPAPVDKPGCHPMGVWLWAYCGWPDHPGEWSCSICATHRTPLLNPGAADALDRVKALLDLYESWDGGSIDDPGSSSRHQRDQLRTAIYGPGAPLEGERDPDAWVNRTGLSTYTHHLDAYVQMTCLGHPSGVGRFVLRSAAPSVWLALYDDGRGAQLLPCPHPHPVVIP